MRAPFAINVDGKSVTIDPSKYPSEWSWFPVDTGDGYQGPGRLACMHHPEWSPFTGVQPCIGCAFGFGNPKCPPDVERPEYWEDSTIPIIRREPGGHWSYLEGTGEPALRCTFHDRRFALDEACRECLEEDNED